MNPKKQIAVVCLILLAASVAASQAAQAPADEPAIADFQAEYLEDLKGLESKFLSIAASVPPEKYDWRPDDAVRSIREVLLHVASTNYTFPNMAGIKPPAAFDMRALLALPADPAKVRDAIAASFAHVRDGVAALSASDLERAIRPNWTVRRTLLPASPRLRAPRPVDRLLAHEPHHPGMDRASPAPPAAATPSQATARQTSAGLIGSVCRIPASCAAGLFAIQPDSHKGGNQPTHA